MGKVRFPTIVVDVRVNTFRNELIEIDQMDGITNHIMKKTALN